MRKQGLNIIFLLSVCYCISCNEKVSQEDLIATALEMKIRQWRDSQLKECSALAIAKAEEYVDSILVIYSLPTKLDTIPKPPKPSKPPKPFFRLKPDSVVVEELKKGN